MITIKDLFQLGTSSAFSKAQLDSLSRRVFVGRKQESAELKKAIASNTPTVLVGRPGSGKSTLIVSLRAEIEKHCPGGLLNVNSRDGGSEIIAFLNTHREGFSERTFLEVENCGLLEQKAFSDLFLRLCEIRNLQIVATVSEPVKGIETIATIFLAPINPREILEVRLKLLAEIAGKKSDFVDKAMRVMDQVVASAPTDITPQEAIQAVRDAMRAWNSECSLPDEPPSESVVISALQHYLRTHVDYLGLAVAIGLYFLATASDREHEYSSIKRHEVLMQQISILVQREKSVTIRYFTNERLNLRSDPGETYHIIRVLPQEEELEVLATARIWLQIVVLSTGEQGWVYAKYVTPIVTAHSSNKKIQSTAESGD